MQLVENLQRLQLSAETIAVDATEWQPEPFDGVLIDAPCTSTGTIRRHPDIAMAQAGGDLAELVDLQRRLLSYAVDLVRSRRHHPFSAAARVEPAEEGEDQIAELLARRPRLRRHPIDSAEFPGLEGFVNAQGDIRTLPSFWPKRGPAPRAAWTEFFASRLVRL